MSAGPRAGRVGAPSIGPAIPAWTIGALGLVAGLVGSVVVIGASGWLVVAAALAVASALIPRGPFATLLVVQLAIAGLDGTDLRVLVLTTHLLLATSLIWAWTPRAARVQLRALLPTAARFAAVQVGAQAIAFVVTMPFGDVAPTAAVALTIAGACGLLALALGLLVPTLRRGAEGD